MSFVRSIIDGSLKLAVIPSLRNKPPARPESIVVLRNNDLGDVLVITPLFEALKRHFPSTRICAGVGPWSLPILANNPWIDEVITVSAPWHNKQTAKHSPNTLAGWRDALFYVFRSPEVETLRRRACTVGIDVLGSPQGSLLLLRAGVPFRIGVRGYAGGHTACQRWVDYDPDLHVGRASLRVAELLGATELPGDRPQIFLTQSERESAEKLWHESEHSREARVIVAPGGGLAGKCWPIENFALLAQTVGSAGAAVAVIGGSAERSLGATMSAVVPQAIDWTGKTSLRETFALVSTADLVLTNSSMAMHAAAAFKKRTVVLLGTSYTSARQHARQWGYPENCVVAGEPPDSEARTPEAVLAMLRAKNWLSSPHYGWE